MSLKALSNRKFTVPWQCLYSNACAIVQAVSYFTYGRIDAELRWHIGGKSNPCWWSIQHWFTRFKSSLHNLQAFSPSQDEHIWSMQDITSCVKIASVQIRGGSVDCRWRSQHMATLAESCWQMQAESVESQLQELFMQVLTSSPQRQLKLSSPDNPWHGPDSRRQILGNSTLWKSPSQHLETVLSFFRQTSHCSPEHPMHLVLMQLLILSANAALLQRMGLEVTWLWSLQHLSISSVSFWQRQSPVQFWHFCWMHCWASSFHLQVRASLPNKFAHAEPVGSAASTGQACQTCSSKVNANARGAIAGENISRLSGFWYLNQTKLMSQHFYLPHILQLTTNGPLTTQKWWWWTMAF